MRVGNGAAVTSQAARHPRPRLEEAAHEFEAQMMKELLKPMTDGAILGAENSGSGGTMTDFATEVLGQCLSRAGGFGIATTVLHGLSQDGTTPQSTPGAARRGTAVSGSDAGTLK
jgi:Rod binding domain-containing protein